jgi:hypothetical protein
MQLNAVFHLPFTELQLEQLMWSRDGDTVIVACVSAQFQINSMNTDPIANQGTGDEIGHQSAHFTYRSCRDTIRIQILIWSQSCRNHKMEPRSDSNASPTPLRTPVFRVTTRTAAR